MNSASTVVFCRKVSRVSNLKKYIQFNSNFSICHVMLRLCCFTNFSLSFVDTVIPKFVLLSHTRKKINFQSFLILGICKSRLYLLDVSTDISILDSLLVYVYHMIIAHHKNPGIFIKYVKGT